MPTAVGSIWSVGRRSLDTADAYGVKGKDVMQDVMTEMEAQRAWEENER